MEWQISPGSKTLELMQRKALRAKRGNQFAPGCGAAAVLSCALAVATSLFGQGQNKAQDLKKAQREVQQGEKAEAAGHWDDALTLYDAAAKDAPGDLGILGHAAALRAKLVRTHTDAAENAAINGDLRRATEELRTALKIDPGNTFLAEREAELPAPADKAQALHMLLAVQPVAPVAPGSPGHQSDALVVADRLDIAAGPLRKRPDDEAGCRGVHGVLRNPENSA